MSKFDAAFMAGVLVVALSLLAALWLRVSLIRNRVQRIERHLDISDEEDES